VTYSLPHDYIEQYLALESFETTEELLELCGATIDQKAVPLLKQRLWEENQRVEELGTKGYIRMREKSLQLVMSLTQLIAALEEQSNESSK
jgi:hypothetical protein